MTDRFVRQLDPPSSAKLHFSDCLHSPNIVVLGDPGAGKSHLFREFSPPNSLFRARDFLNAPLDALRGQPTLFIDALDEKRSGRTDVTPIDLMVSRLMELKPRCVRIACRAADWLGTSDLSAFRPYFASSGGFTVLALEALTEAEGADLLAGLGCPNSAAVMEEAKARGVGDLLGNPQNLTMLYSVVRAHDWPHTHSELYHKAVELLLTEPNDEHQQKEAGAFSAGELMLPAGAVCAARLIADVSGISLAGASIEGYPTYRDLNLVPSAQLRAALTRRLFVGTGVSDSVDYGHRTVAEYLGAYFLAHQVRSGLPFERVRALISVDGRPASELRGLHAWLAVLLPDYARELIVADPFGVLSYGDAAALSPPLRAALIEEISVLAERDPWFRHGNWSAAPLRGLAGTDMVDRFRGILQRPTVNLSLVSVVLDAVALGTPMPALQPELLQILTSSNRGEGERLRALEALLHLGAAAHGSCIAAYVSIAAEPSAFPLRARVLSRLLSLGLAGSTEIADLLNDSLMRPPTSITDLGLYNLADQVPDSMLRPILDRVQLQRLTTKSSDSHDARQALRVLDILIARQIGLAPNDMDYAAKWLIERAHVTRYYSYAVHDTLEMVLKSDEGRLQRLIDAAIPHLGETAAWSMVVRLSQVFAGAADAAVVLRWALLKLTESATRPDPLLYEIALDCVFTAMPLRRAEFEYLVTLASQNPQLQSICAAACYWPIPDWRVEQSARSVANATKRALDQSQMLQAFDEHAETIRSGAHLGWLSRIAHIYFGFYADSSEKISPRGRLIALLGETRTDVALAGLRALVATGHTSSITDILQTHANEKIWPWWYAIAAGLDEYVAANGDLGGISTDYLASAVAIDVLFPTFEHAGNTTSVMRHAWAAWFAQHDSQRYCDTLLELIRFGLQRDGQYLYGFSELLQTPAIVRSVAIRNLLYEFPQAPAHYLIQLLRAWIPEQRDVPDTSLIRYALTKTAADRAAHVLWLAAGLIVDFTGFRAKANALPAGNARRALVWASRDLWESSRSVPVSYTEYLLRLTCSCFSRTDMLLTSTGNRSDWDATQFALGMLSVLATDISDAAMQALGRTLKDVRTRRFHDNIKHAIAQQKIRRIDADFRQPTWKATLDTLANGAPVNMADLQALVLAQLRDLQTHLSGSNTDLYKRFWNEGPHGGVLTPKSENSCRNVIVDELRARLSDEIRVEPEGHMARDRRTDVAVYYTDMKLVVEFKRHYHPKVWSAASEQLDRFYVRDPEAKGFGIYGVFWFGKKKATPAIGGKRSKPRSAHEMSAALQETLPSDLRTRIGCIVLDVSGDDVRGNARKVVRRARRKSSSRTTRKART